MKFFVFLGFTTVFARIFFEYADGQIPLPMPFPGLFQLPGLAPMVKPFHIRWPTLHKRNDYSSANPKETQTDSFITPANKATSTVVKETTVKSTTLLGFGSYEWDEETWYKTKFSDE